MFGHFLRHDTRFALRLLRKSPAATATGIVMLAIGIGINSAIFSFVQGLLFRPLLLPEMETLVSVWAQNPHQGRGKSDVSPANFKDFKEQCRFLSDLAAYEWWETVLQEKGEAEFVPGMRVTEDFFKCLKVSPAFGRYIGADDMRNGQYDVVVLGHRFWQRRFGGREDLLGKTLVLDGRVYSIIGIMPAGFEFPITAELWVPINLTGEAGKERTKRFLQVIGRLQQGVPKERARAELRAISSRLASMYPASNEDWEADMALLRERIVSDSGTTNPLIILSFATALVWLLACASVINLQLAAATGRRKEMATRAALGASSWRLISQMLVESLLVGLVAGGVSVLFAFFCIKGIKNTLPTDIMRYMTGWSAVGINPVVLLYTLVAALLTGIATGIIPAILTSRASPYETLKDTARGSSPSRSHHYIRSTLVVVEIGLALVLLHCTLLLFNGFLNILRAPKGFSSTQTLTFEVPLSPTRYSQTNQTAAFVERAASELYTLPTVSSVAFGTHLPFAHVGWDSRPIQIDGNPVPQGKEKRAVQQSVSPDYFKTLRVPLREGRYFTSSDRAGTPLVAIVSESLARLCWQGSPLGKRIEVVHGSERISLTVIGVVGNIKRSWSDLATDSLYMPLAQQPAQKVFCAVHLKAPPETQLKSIRSIMHRVDPLQPITYVKPFDQMVSENMVALRVPAEMLGALSLLTLILAGVGVYSILAFTSKQRSQEIGIRMALGAEPLMILKMILAGVLRLIGIAMLVGIPAALGSGTILANLFAVEGMPLSTIVGAALVIAIVALGGALLPARQAARVSPSIVLRGE